MSLVAIEPKEEPPPPGLEGTWAVLRRGIRESPELRRGLGMTVVISLGVTVATLVTPVLVQQVLDHGFTGGFRARFVIGICSAAFALVALTFVAGRSAAKRLVKASEEAMMQLRVRAFSHIHELSIADQSEEKRGVFVARVTADVDALQEFMEWAGIAWLISLAQVVGALGFMLYYSRQLTIAVLILLIPLIVVVWMMQGRLAAAFNLARTRVGELLSEVSESVMGASVVRAYGLEETTDRKVKQAIAQRYDAEVVAHFRAATLFPMSTVFYAAAIAVVFAVGAGWGPSWGLSFGHVVAFLFLADEFLHVFTDLPEIYGETQTAIAGWRKVLGVFDIPVEVAEPTDGVTLPTGPLSVEVRDIRFAYRDGGPVLRGISVEIAAGAHVAIVGETGCGKTTFAKLLSRLADPVTGQILIGGIQLDQVSGSSRRRAIRMVPQDGFLFDSSVRGNVLQGREGATDADVDRAFRELGLDQWVSSLAEGLDTQVGQRGEALSVGERQLVALARAHISDPGLLILDEATSAVDPATEARITEALRRLSEGRTTVTIAHRLSTAEQAERILVFDAGRIVQDGTHAELIGSPGTYAGLYASWLGNTREAMDAV
jgi:ATP-binding cassette subfamily B protein